jgi:hypothetical protein
LGVDRQINISDSTAKLGDSGVSAILGWQEGNHHWSVTATGVIPTGFYDPDRLAFVGLNRPGVECFSVGYDFRAKTHGQIVAERRREVGGSAALVERDNISEINARRGKLAWWIRL